MKRIVLNLSTLLFATVILAWVNVAEAQILLIDPATTFAETAPKAYRVAFFTVNGPTKRIGIDGGGTWKALFKELRRLGYVEGKNLIVERYTTKGENDAGANMAARIVGTAPDLIMVPGAVPLIRAIMARTKTIPLVVLVPDPLILGLTKSLARPGGNVTGFSFDGGAAMDPKRLELLREVVPSARRVGYLLRRDQWDDPFTEVVRNGARRMGMTLVPALSNVPVRKNDYDRVFAGITNEKVDAVMGPPTPEISKFKRKIIDLTMRGRLPSIFCQPPIARAGGLMAYGPNVPELFRRAASYIDKILKGAKPGDLPFQQAEKFKLVVNLKTARALGITIPPSILYRADKVIK